MAINTKNDLILDDFGYHYFRKPPYTYTCVCFSIYIYLLHVHVHISIGYICSVKEGSLSLSDGSPTELVC